MGKLFQWVEFWESAGVATVRMDDGQLVQMPSSAWERMLLTHPQKGHSNVPHDRASIASELPTVSP